jgi:hypothetical protein
MKLGDRKTIASARMAVAWRKAAADLGVRFVSPFGVKLRGRTYWSSGWLPDFGCPLGAIIAGRHTVDEIFDVCDALGYYASGLNPDYYETYNRDNVTLVDIRSKPVTEITPSGLRTADAEYALDAIVFATGFDAMTGAMKEIDIHTDAGMSIRAKWEYGPRTYLGIMIAGFPNLFMITGPQSPGVKSQMILACEQHVDWIADCVQYLRKRGLACIEAEEDAEDAWLRHNNEVADRTLYPLANSWYVGANIPGKPRVFMPYVGGVSAYKKKCDEVAARGYEGFHFDFCIGEQRFAAN